MITVPVSVAATNQTIPVTVTSGSEAIGIQSDIEINVALYPSYEGEYNFTPSNEVQVIQANNFVMHGDIIIDAIPNNYGLITQSGAGIRVS